MKPKKPTAIRIRLRTPTIERDLDVIYMQEAASKLGVSNDAMRLRVHRQMNEGRDQAIPTPFKFGGQWAWKRKDFDAFMKKVTQGVES
jgi:predicted DNA-binding transcriptional regulator AlpA